MEEAAKEIERLREEVRMPTPHEDALRMIDERESKLARLREQLIDCTTSHQKANAEVERLDDELARLRELLNEAREAALWLLHNLKYECDKLRVDLDVYPDHLLQAKKRWPWLEDGTDAERNET